MSICKVAHNRFSCLSIAWALSCQPPPQWCCCSLNPPCLAMGPAWLWPVPNIREVPGSLAGAVLVPPSWLPLPGPGVGLTAAVRVWQSPVSTRSPYSQKLSRFMGLMPGVVSGSGSELFLPTGILVSKNIFWDEQDNSCNSILWNLKQLRAQLSNELVQQFHLFYRCWRLWNLRSCSLEWSVSGCQSREAGLCLWADDTSRKPAMLSSLLTPQWEPVLPLNPLLRKCGNWPKVLLI